MITIMSRCEIDTGYVFHIRGSFMTRFYIFCIVHPHNPFSPFHRPGYFPRNPPAPLIHVIYIIVVIKLPEIHRQ